MSNELKGIIFLACVIILMWGGCWFLLAGDTDRGTFGDMFGSVNSLFSGLAFLGVVYAILLQRQELSLQRKELELTRNELKKSADAQEKSEKSLVKQALALEKTQQLSAISIAVESIEKRIEKIPRSGDSSVVASGTARLSELNLKMTRLVTRLDEMTDELVNK
ncbi:MAG: hypothetical protein ACKVJE_22740 [Pseudomonadales bacterium]